MPTQLPALPAATDVVDDDLFLVRDTSTTTDKKATGAIVKAYAQKADANNMYVGNASNAGATVNTNLLGDTVASTKNATATMTVATPCVVTWTSHGLSTYDKIYFTTTGALPTNVAASTTYYVTVINANTFNISTTLANAIAGTLIASAGTQSGTHTVYGGGLVVPDASTTVDGLVTNRLQTFSGIKNNASMPAFTVGLTAAGSYTQNGGFGNITWAESGTNTLSFDQGSNFTAGATAGSAAANTASPTGGFTVPTGGGGVYWVSGMTMFFGANIVVNQTYTFRIFKNSGTFIGDFPGLAYTAGQPVFCQGGFAVFLAAGDTLYGKPLMGGSAPGNTVTIWDQTYFSAVKLY